MSVKVLCYPLVLTEDNTNCLGRRYIVYTKFGRNANAKIALDFSEDVSNAESYLYSFLTYYDCKPEIQKTVIAGRIENGCFITKHWSEGLAAEVASTENLKALLNSTFVEYARQLKVYNTIKDKYEQYCNTLMRLLRTNSVEVFTNDIQYYKEEFEMSARFLGGFSSWSGGDDICDADTLSFKVQKAINESIKEFNKLNKDGVEVEWTIGEKAYTYFSFKPKV